MADSYNELVKMTVAALKADATLSAIVGAKVYTDVPQEANFPFVSIHVESAPWSAKDFAGMEHSLMIKGFSREGTPKEAADIRSAIIDVINRNEGTLALDTMHIVSINYETGSIFKEPDGKTWQSFAQFRFVIA